MALFLAIPLIDDAERLDGAVAAAIPEQSRFKLQAEAGWLIDFDGTSEGLSDALGITGQPAGQSSQVGSVLISTLGSYYGRGPTTMWEWIKVRLEA